MKVTEIVLKEKIFIKELRGLLAELKEERKTITDFDLEIVYASITYRLESILEDFE